MDDRQRACLMDLVDDPLAGPLWRPLAEALEAALDGGARDALQRAALSAARSLALSHGTRLPLLIDQLLLGLDRLRICGLDERGDTFFECRTVLLRAVAEGYAEGLDETVAQLRREAESQSPVDPRSGVLRRRQTAEQLSLELLRCQRLDLPLGVVAAMIADGGALSSRPRSSRRVDKVGRVLRDSVRRYDGVGTLETGGHVLFLPGVSRDGLLAAAERLHRLLEEDQRATAGARIIFVLLHLDCVDLSATEILAAVGKLDRAVPPVDHLLWV